MLAWLEEVNIFNEFFGIDVHTEVLNKSHTILKFLYINKRFGEAELAKMWDATHRHENNKIEIFKAIRKLCMEEFSIPILKLVFQKVQSIAPKD